MVTVTLVNALVLGRSALHHSLAYRSVVVLGDARPVEDPAEKLRALRCVSITSRRGAPPTAGRPTSANSP